MVPQNIVAPTFKLYDANGELNKKWFIYWKEGGVRKRKYGNINSGKTLAQRRALAKDLEKKLKLEYRRRVSKTERAIDVAVSRLSSAWSEKTLQSYKSIFNTFIDYLGGREVTVESVDEFFIELRRTKHGTTVNRYRTVLKRIFSEVGLNFLFDDIRMVKATRTPKRYFQSHQARLLGMEIKSHDPDLWFFIQFMYYCFIRPNELRLMRVSDVELDDMVIRVRGD
ncbi:MAG: hypothetical protein AAFU67_04595, partial [Bacteroidota bacterium]